MVLVVTSGVIESFGCQGGETECDAASMTCTEIDSTGSGHTWYHCRCCNGQGCGGSETTGFCTVQIGIPLGGGAPVMRCVNTGHCSGGTFCPEDPTPVTGVATCPCG